MLVVISTMKTEVLETLVCINHVLLLSHPNPQTLVSFLKLLEIRGRKDKVSVLGWTFLLAPPTSIEETKPEKLGLRWESPS